jgi:cAMP-dependent protein kinase regulator
MGAGAISGTDDRQLSEGEVKGIVGDEKYDSAIFAQLSNGKGFVTVAQLKEYAAKSTSNFSKRGDDHDHDSAEDDEPDDLNAPVYVPPAVISKKGRKTGVSAESMDPSKMKDQMKNITCIVKEPEVHQNLLRVVAKSPLLRALDDEQKDMIVKAFSGPQVFPPGQDIIVQGEIGDVFYLLEEGLVDVYISKGGNPQIKVHTYKPGDAFGELAIMYNAPRAATCRSQTTSKLWALDRVSFKCIVVAAAMQKREIYKGFLQNVPILASLNEMEVMTLADSLAEETYQDGAVICNEGEEGNYLYIIKEGVAVCYKNVGGIQTEVLRVNPGTVLHTHYKHTYSYNYSLLYSHPDPSDTLYSPQ